MTREERNRRSRLESVLARHTASEWRCLADLDRAGFEFECIEDAYQELKRIREQQVFTARQVEIAVEAGRKAI